MKRHAHFYDDREDELETPSVSLLWLGVLALALLAAFIVDVAKFIGCMVYAVWAVCVVGNEKAAVRRRFK